MGISQRQVVQECFDGDRKRRCTYCPGHHTKGGICCFGQKFEDDDAQCACCPHNVACEPATFEWVTQHEDGEWNYGPPPRQVAVPGRPARPAVHAGRPAQGQVSHGLISAPRKVPATTEPQAIEPAQFHERGFFEQMGLHAMWGAMEGAFEMLLSFLRNRRPD